MADEVRYVEHPSADVSYLVDAVQGMESQLNNLSSEVVSVNSQVDSIQDSFAQFLKEFRDFVMQDLKDRRLQEALSDQVTLQQELEQRFSRHQRVRYFVTGILQAADTSLVKKETMAECTEELMVSVPHYWLAPALIALSAWLNDDRPLAEKALKEAISRDDEKTSLLFALICRRASRNQAAFTWLQRYFAMQDPMKIEQKLIVVLDAYANGLFGRDSHGLCAQQLGQWIAEMEDTVGFREAQIDRWATAIRGKIPGEDFDEQYPYLKKYATNFSEIRQTLNNAALHQEMHSYLRNVFEQPVTNVQELKKSLDELLNSLVTNYDTAELPLRKQKRFADLVVQEKGDEAEASRLFDAEQSAFDEITDVTQLLTDAAMNPELVHASTATQKLSLSSSREWLIEAYDTVTLENRKDVVDTISFEIEGFEGSTTDGANEAKLTRDAEDYFNEIRRGRIDATKQSMMDYFLLGAGILLFLLGIFGVLPWFIGLAAGVAGGIKYFLGQKKVKDDIDDINRTFDETIEKAGQIIRALCAETVDMRRETARLEGGYEPLMQYMKSIAPEQFVRSGDQRRVSIA